MTRFGVIGLVMVLAGAAACGISSPTSDNTSITGTGSGTTATTASTVTSTGGTSTGGIMELVPQPPVKGGQTGFSGTVGGVGFTPAAVAFDVTGDPNNLGGGAYTVGNPNVPAYVALTLSSDPNFCTNLVAASGGGYDPNSTRVDFIIQSFDDSSDPNTIATGSPYAVTMPVGSTGLVASALFTSLDSTCNQSIAAAYMNGTQGSVTLNTLNLQTTPAQLTGSFSVFFGNHQQGSGTGQFTASPCPGLAAVMQTSTFVPACLTP